jgi:hypothetical protein
MLCVALAGLTPIRVFGGVQLRIPLQNSLFSLPI